MWGRELVLPQRTFMLVHRLTSLLFVRLQHNIGALVKGRPPDCHGVFRTLGTFNSDWRPSQLLIFL